MTHPMHSRGRAASILLWAGSIVVALGIGLSGVAKFTPRSEWDKWFVGWGYPAWFTFVVGAAEVVGAIGLLVPRFAVYAAALLGAVMIGAFVTIQLHRGGGFGWGATPLVYIIILSSIAFARRKDRVSL